MQNTPDALLYILQSAKEMLRVLIQQLLDHQYKLVEKSAKSVDVLRRSLAQRSSRSLSDWRVSK